MVTLYQTYPSFKQVCCGGKNLPPLYIQKEEKMNMVESVKYGVDTATSDIHLDFETFGYCS